MFSDHTKQGYLSCVLLHCLMTSNCFSNALEYHSFEVSVENLSYFILHPVEWFDLILHDKIMDEDCTPTFTTKMIRFCSLLVELLIQNIYTSPEMICLAIAIPLLSVARNFKKKLTNEISINDVYKNC